ncbi:hypothetical protein MWU65_15340 [Cellulophaga sp. F20128]|uniref:hypothetical protein n=1 Tax=Cellulophaga sp. F20128 TaxID=2926413 RepID=UPI001FF1B04D|nr:hypothetical protein [Cellulophaga sp. F20128]MCK0158563.1 hypothetical protein [Cellulophaga sp. F20128]
MRKIAFRTIAFLLFSSTLLAQDFGDILNAAKDAFGESKVAAKEQADTDANWDTTMKEIEKKIEDPEFKKLASDFSEALAKFSEESQTGKCLQIMGAYVEMLAYCDMKAETEPNPCKRKDWLGIESLVLFAGTSINYCPQEFYGMSNDGSVDYDSMMEYEKKIGNYFFGNYFLENYKKFNNQKEEIMPEIYNEFARKHNGKMWKDLTEEAQISVKNYVEALVDDELEDFVAKDPHLQLFNKFLKANHQLGLISTSSEQLIVDFVGNMFNPEFLIKKTLEIANKNSAIKCRTN